jgi:hypothetical protein
MRTLAKIWIGAITLALVITATPRAEAMYIAPKAWQGLCGVALIADHTCEEDEIGFIGSLDDSRRYPLDRSLER